MTGSQPAKTKALEVFRSAGGILSTGDAMNAGVHPRELYALRDEGKLEQISRGIYRLAELPPLSEPDLATVCARSPKAVVSLISALRFHELTSEIPHAVSIALPRGTARPQLDWPPLDVHWISEPALSYGIESHDYDGISIRIYTPAKTVADCFRFRNQIGTIVAVEALRSSIEEQRATPAEIMRAAEVCRVGRVIKPYMEALL